MCSVKLYDLNYKQFSQGVSPSFHVILKETCDSEKDKNHHCTG